MLERAALVRGEKASWPDAPVGELWAGLLGALLTGTAFATLLGSGGPGYVARYGTPVEEMVDLVKYQHAYSAASRVITVVDEMLDRIINRMGT